MKPVIYIDVLFLVNFFINGILLLITSQILKRPFKTHRLALGAMAGSLYAVCMFFPKMQFMYTLLSKFIISLLIISISFKIVKLSLYIKTVCVFYLTSFTLGGGLLALLYFTDIGKSTGTVMKNGVFYFNLPFGTLIITTVVSYILIKIFCRVHKSIKHISYKEVSVNIGDKHIDFRALVDTGNMLSDPLSNTPVMIAEINKLRPHLPQEFCMAFENSECIDALSLPESMGDFQSRIRLIPYSSLGEKNGILIGFKPDSITVSDKTITNIIVGLYKHNLSQSHEYDALLNPEILSQ